MSVSIALQLLIDKSLLHKIKVEESVWTIDSARKLLTVTLEKTKEVMWKSVFKGEKEIDLTKVDTTRNISEFDPECQAAIQRATYDQHLKRLGKPTSSEKVQCKVNFRGCNKETLVYMYVYIYVYMYVCMYIYILVMYCLRAINLYALVVFV